jgi:superfamily II DNA or RNA helicase
LDLIDVRSAETALRDQAPAPAGEAVLRLLAHAIVSCNDTWGVFSPSRIDLLPHQLWVCRKVLEGWPFRWLIADDVGLGKTIEAGLILWPLIARQLVKRLLILAPASLVTQWQQRMRGMFDIRMAVYLPEADTPKQGFWETHQMVAASLHTLRDDHKGRHERLLAAEKWDLVIVDEAHHVNFDERAGKTLNYQLLEQLLSPERAGSALFFTGTPHRGKHHNFFALVELLRPDLFDRTRDPGSQMEHLREVMIRNNKQTVTDLSGKPLFFDPFVDSKVYGYNAEERNFYDKLTQFILSGRAYASSLSQSQGQAVILVLIVMQKLASSSVAAVRHTLRNRLEKLRGASEFLSDHTFPPALGDANDEDSDVANQRDEDRVSQLMLKLMEHEQRSLEELLEAANQVKTETKIAKILDYTRVLPPTASVLFFTEYKATQSMLISALMREYGEDAVTFINGDRFLPKVVMPSGMTMDLRCTRESAADDFNLGKRRFLVSTEAAGEGIDLQESCHRLVHVDLPWNPMRLHQRHGRLNRYGQRFPVEITLFRNPDTVEGQIWGLLNEKIANINSSLAASMDEPEDLFPLVLGMTAPSTFNDLYFCAPKDGGLKEWFDAKTATLGGQDVLDTVRDLVGNTQKFDFQSISNQIPRLDLPELQPFFESMLRYHRKQIRRADGAIAFKTPERWVAAPGVVGSNENVVFTRRPPKRGDWKVFGVGSPVVNQALDEAKNFEAPFAVLEPRDGLAGDLYVFQVEDKVTGSDTHIRKILCGLLREGENPPCFRSDADLIGLLNPVLEKLPQASFSEATSPVNAVRPSPSEIDVMRNRVIAELPCLRLPFRLPEVSLLGVLLIQSPTQY